LHRHRAALLATVCVFSVVSPAGLHAQPAPPDVTPDAPTGAPPAPVHHARRVPRPLPPAAPRPTGAVIKAIRIVGNQRIENSTILSYMLVEPGDPFTGDRVDQSLRTLYATGLFSDVSLHRDGDDLVVQVHENPLVNSISFEGNHNVKEEDLRKELQLRPRAVFSVRMAQTDRQKLLGVYAGKGRFAATVEPELVRLRQNRVNVIFKIVEGPETKITRIIFVGNKSFPEDVLKSVIESREDRLWRLLSSSTQFNPERINFDRELLRRFYISHGYADFSVSNTVAELSPDKKAFFLTFQIHEGERYRVGKVSVTSEVAHVDAATYRKLVRVEPGAFYNGDLVEKTSTLIQDRVRADGHNFVVVNPRIARDTKKHVVDLVFDIADGPRQYVERIDITGNSVTKDKVIRREFRFAEGDPYDSALARKTKQRLTDLGYFGDVKITPQPGSAPDKVVALTEVTEKATGQLSLGGGYSTDAGILGNAGLRQTNLVGTGIDAGITGTIGAYESQLDLSATDPYFLDRNLVAGADLFYLNNNNQYVAVYSEQRIGTTLRLGYAYNDHVAQSFSYLVTDRDVHNLQSYASVYVKDEAGYSLLSQLGQTLSFDYRDSRVNAHSGFIVRLGTDFAGLGGTENYVRSKIDGTYFLPLDSITGNSDWGFAFSAGAGYLYNLQSHERIIDRFFLGGDNLRGFLDQGVGPHSVAFSTCFDTPKQLAKLGESCAAAGEINYQGSDSLGGNFIYTQSTELHFPLPVSKDFGLSGRAFADIGGLSGLNVPPNALTSCLVTSAHNKKGQAIDRYGNVITQCYYDDSSPRVGVGVGVSWNSPFGLINIDIGIPVVKKAYDQTQIIRFGFGTRFQ
jgi:outer membrane protein insertion porin family